MALSPNSPQKILVNSVADLLHSEKYFDAAKLVAKWFSETTGSSAPTIETKQQADEILTLLLHWCLDNNGYEEAAQLLWSPTLFDIRPESTKRVWAAFESANLILLMGAGSMSKSYSMGGRLFLEWVRDPEYTTVKVLGPSEQHLEDNLFSHLVTLHRQATIPLPGTVGKLFIGSDSRSRKGSISGVVIPLGKKAAGRLQGTKKIQRKKPHKTFGPQSRMYIFLDEIVNIPPGVWKDIDNVITGMSPDGGLKIIGAFNPTDPNDEVGKRTEPPKGWGMFDADKDFDWTSTRGWRVVRLDALQCENIKTKKVVFPGLQTWEGFNLLIVNSGGMDSAGYWAMGRGCFPPTGTPMSIIPAGLLADIKAEFIWYDRPTPCAGVDLAFLGGDVAVFAKGSFGLVTGIKFPPSLQHLEGRTVMFKNSRGHGTMRYGLQLENLFPLPKGDTVAIKNEVLRLARQLSIRPEWLCVDKTGNGQGVYDLLWHEYGEIVGINYSESASETKIMAEDHAPADKLYDRMQTELWFALRKFIEFGYLKILPSVDTEKLFPQLTGRRYRLTGKKSKTEEKDVYQSRCNGVSPDEADAFTLIVQGVRRTAGFIPGMDPANSSENMDDEEDEWNQQQVRISIDNRFEDL